MADIQPSARLFIAQTRALAYALEAVVQDLATAGVHTPVIRAQIEALERALAASVSSDV